MKFLCICPTWGRTPELLANTIECFERQAYAAKDRFLLIVDDLGNVRPQSGDTWQIVSTHQRFPNLPSKYDFAVRWTHSKGRSFDAISIWDDDDVYLPDHLASHATALRNGQWSRPKHIWSTCKGLALEPPGRRFWACTAMRADALPEPCVMSKACSHPEQMDFDQQILRWLQQTHGSPINTQSASFVFRWKDTGNSHCQTNEGPEGRWYDDAVPRYREPIGTIRPALDQSACDLFDRFVG